MLSNDEVLELQFGLPYAAKAHTQSNLYRTGGFSERADKEWETVTTMIKESIKSGLVECNTNWMLLNSTVSKLEMFGYKVTNSCVGASISWF